jgi:hypothetical protein
MVAISEKTFDQKFKDNFFQYDYRTGLLLTIEVKKEIYHNGVSNIEW